MLQVKRLTETAQLPVRQHKGDAGYDLSADEDIVIPSGEWKLISTGISFKVPSGTYGRIAPRSGLSYKKGTMIGAGVIDEGYRGHVKVLIFNMNFKSELRVTKGDRIAQLILEKIATPEVLEVDDLEESKRGDNGFGSSGK